MVIRFLLPSCGNRNKITRDVCQDRLTLDGKILGVLGESGKQLKQFGWVHEMACPSENEIYVAEILNWRLTEPS